MSPSSSAVKKQFDQPYWLLLPVWLMQKYRGPRTLSKGDKQFLIDILWAQYCLFLFIRIQDDLFDQQTNVTSLIFIADRFLLEAERILSTYFDSQNKFWNIYRMCLTQTITAIPVVDNLQRSPRTDSKIMLNAYVQVNAIFKIGSVAMCLRHDHIVDYRRISRFADGIAKGSQILDDLMDIEEDVRRRRYNYAVNVAIGKSRIRIKDRRSIMRQIGNAFISDSMGPMLLSEIEYQMKRAFMALEPLNLPAAARCWHAYHQWLQAVRVGFLQKRVQGISGRHGYASQTSGGRKNL